jgi:folylpolyglutamate synthase/dihydropteroate synthase
VTLARGRVAGDGMLVVTGSLYVVAEVRALLMGSTEIADPGSLAGP